MTTHHYVVPELKARIGLSIFVKDARQIQLFFVALTATHVNAVGRLLVNVAEASIKEETEPNEPFVGQLFAPTVDVQILCLTE